MKQYYVYGHFLNVYLYMLGFDSNKEEDTPTGVRFYYDRTDDLLKAIAEYRSDDFWTEFLSSERIISKAKKACS